MKCGNCDSESGDVEYSLEGRKFFYCHSCRDFTLIPDRLEKDVGG